MIKNDCPNQVIKMGNNIINFDKFLLSTEVSLQNLIHYYID